MRWRGVSSERRRSSCSSLDSCFRTSTLYGWLTARLSYLQCVSNGDTAVLHYTHQYGYILIGSCNRDVIPHSRYISFMMCWALNHLRWWYVYFTGTCRVYEFIREDLEVKFFDGQRTLDLDLQKVFDSINNNRIDTLLGELFPESSGHV